MSENIQEHDSPSALPEPASTPVVAASPVFWRNPWAWLAIIALALAFWQWMETRTRLAMTQEDVARTLAAGAEAQQETKVAARQAQEQVAAMQTSIGGLEARLADFQGQTAALESLYQELAKSRDEATLLDIEQSVTLAAQQMQLAGNVQAAVAALQTADAKLARFDRPQFIPLRKALGRDLARLRALPFVDFPGISLKLENMAASVDGLGLAMDARPSTVKQAAKPELVKSSLAWWQALGEEVWDEVRGLVRIQRFDRVEPVLLAPGQEFFLRENLKLRLLNAR
ncbi:MAG TPA: uroporphyrinogen-III C-methyltransferase, partial [Rhodocyclaceae bacterium]|nr:uroporphyrinogen-III C-methyltransferase [Rhodocyclaceae bacterium]